MPARVYEEFTAVAVRDAEDGKVDLAAGDQAAGTTSMTLQESFGASPGYSAETSAGALTTPTTGLFGSAMST